MSVSSKANPAMLKWARDRVGLSLEEVSKADKIPLQTLTDWESSIGSPSLPQLRKLSVRYKRPLMVFYLEQPPREFSVVKDFRTIAHGGGRAFSTNLRRALQIAQERQQWAADYLEDTGEKATHLVGSVSATAVPSGVANQLRNMLGVSLLDQVSCVNHYAAFNMWRKACEEFGVYVFQSTRVEVREMRGCALPNAYAPAVLLNAGDAISARIFTLMHEMAHILIGESAITGSGIDEFDLRPDQAIERFCNSVAANILVPKDDFVRFIPSDWRNRDDLIIHRSANKYHVSRAVICLRLVEVGLADQAYLDSKWPSLQSRPVDTKKDVKIPPYVLSLSRAGRGFTRLALSAFHSGAIHGGELSELIRLKMNHLPLLEAEMYPNRVQSAS